MKFCIIGLGYIGLPTAAILGARNHNVIGVDVNPETVDIVNQGKIHIVEPELDLLVKAAVSSGNLTASTTPEAADVFIIAVPTPFNSDRSPDLSYVEAASKAIAPYLAKGNTVILESTSPVGATEKVAQWLSAERTDLTFPEFNVDNENIDIFVAHCPERVLPGKVIRELVSNDRIIGGINLKSAEKTKAIYQTFVEGECITTLCRTAELCKLTENSFRDVNIAFANELSMIAEKQNIDVWELIALANRHPRVNILTPGPGVGGHCIAVDPWFIIHSDPDNARLIRTAREVNDFKPEYVIKKIKDAMARFKQPIVACLGLSFKADIDDLRESPSLSIVEKLCSQCSDGRLLAVEPNIKKLPAKLSKFSNVELSELQHAVQVADIVVVLVDHREFKSLTSELLAQKVLIDTRGIIK